ncbi:FAD-binding domain-containing protein 50 [Elsinoe fawcettii]|nr:FAD-binding domain-containing protein 50 [Elsinoe fawcettii]
MPLGEMVPILFDSAVEKGVDVRFEHKVQSIGQDDREAWVEVDVMQGDTCLRKDRVSADYVIGCDGASSIVRKELFGREWPGLTLPYRFMVQNVFYDGFEEHGWSGGNYIVDHDHWGLIAKRGRQGLWRVTYGDNRTDLTDEELLDRRPWHFEHMLPGSPKPHQYRVEQTNTYSVHNRCVSSFRVGRVFLVGDAAHVCNPMGGYGCMSAILDVDGLATCLAGYYHNKSDESILDKYADIRRDKFLRFVDDRSMRNLARCATADPDTVKDTDPFFQLVQKLNEDPNEMKAFLLVSLEGNSTMAYVNLKQKISSIEHDFTQYYIK